jgi:hypothetical protein
MMKGIFTGLLLGFGLLFTAATYVGATEVIVPHPDARYHRVGLPTKGHYQVCAFTKGSVQMYDIHCHRAIKHNARRNAESTQLYNFPDPAYDQARAEAWFRNHPGW